MGIPRDRRCKGYPDRDGPVASVQRQEEARHTLEGARAFQKEGGLNTGKKVAKDVLDVSDTPCQISLTTMKAAKRNQDEADSGKAASLETANAPGDGSCPGRFGTLRSART